MSKFNGSYKGYVFDVLTQPSATGTMATFTSAVLGDKAYDSEEDIEKALAAFDLKQRKTFKNATAWIITPRCTWSNQGDKVSKVTVTSIDGETEAWVKQSNGRREKVRRRDLFASKDTATAYIKESEDLRTTWESDVKALEARKDLWVP